MRSKADCDSLENKRRNAVTYLFSLFFLTPAVAHWSDAFFLANANLSSYQIRPKVDGGCYLISLMFFYFLSCFSESSCARSLPSGVMEAKTAKDSRGQRLRGVGMIGFGGALSENSDWANTAHAHVAIFSMKMAKTPGLCLWANHLFKWNQTCLEEAVRVITRSAGVTTLFFSLSLISKFLFFWSNFYEFFK